MCMGGGAKSPDPVTYTVGDQTFANSYDAEEYRRRRQLAAAFGYDVNQGLDGAPVYTWQAATQDDLRPFRQVTLPGDDANLAPTRYSVPQDRFRQTGTDAQGNPVYEMRVQTGATGGLDEYLRSTGQTDAFRDYYDTGLTAADYRTDQRLRQQDADAKAREEQRKKDVAAGRTSISDAFARFNDNYYGGIRQDVLDYYMPQVDRQNDKAREQVIYDAFRRQGANTGTMGNRLGDLATDYEVAKADVANRADGAAAEARERTDTLRSNLLAYNESAADPGAVNERLSSEIGRAQAYQPQLTPLGALFNDYVTPLANIGMAGYMAQQKGYPGWGVFGGKSQNVVR